MILLKNKKIISISFLIFTLGLKVEAKPSYCGTGESSILHTYRPSVKPRYFFKSIGMGDEISFVGFNEKKQDDENYIYHLKSGKLTPVPGKLDPIGLYQTHLLSVPLDDNKGGLLMMFYDIRELREKSLKVKPLLPPDASLIGRYQSMGVLKKEGKLVKFRLITDGHGGGDYRDYEVDFTNTPAKMKILGKSQLICKNLRDKKTKTLMYKLPMISKDGKFFSAFDVTEQKMRVFELSAEGNCKETSNPTLSRGDIGKVDFSLDSKRVAFHYSDRSLDLTPLEFGTPGEAWQLRSAIYNFEEQTYQLLPFFGKGTHTYYPTFLPNGNVMALKVENDQYEFIEVDVSKLKKIQRKLIEKYAGLSTEEFKPFQKLSQRWMQECLKDENKSMWTNRILSLFSLTPEQCLDLAKTDKLEHICKLLK